MVTFLSYAAASTLLTLLSFVYAWSSRQQFYPSMLFLTTHKLNLVILGNLAFFFLLSLGQLLKATFLGQLSRDEVEELVQQSKYAITETCLALTIFREELNIRVLTLFTLLLFIKIFHWLSVMRVEHIARTHGLPLSTHLRLAALLAFLTLLDAAFLFLLSSHLLQHREASVLLLFAFEFTILTVSVLTTACKYALHLVDLQLEGRWQSKSVALFYLELASDLLRLLLYLVFFLLICTYYGLPLHLIRELCITFYNLRERITKFIAYRRITRNMNERFPSATREELEAGDTTCIICREDMTEAKKLACGHCFHFACLRTWLERSSSCPTCRASISAAPSPTEAGAAAAANEPPPVLPPLPAHLQAHLDAMMRERAGDGRPPAAGDAAAAATAAPSAAAAGNTAQGGMAASGTPAEMTPPPAFPPFISPSHMTHMPTPPASSPRAQSHGGLAASSSHPPLPQVRLHPFFPLAQPATPAVVKEEEKEGQTASAALLPHPSPTHFPLAFPGAFPGPMPFSAPHPAPFFSPFMAHASPFALPPPGYAAASPPPLPPASLDPSYLQVLSHHTLLLQSHMAMLESELRQVKLLWDRQVEVQDMWMKQANAIRAKEEEAKRERSADSQEEEKAELVHTHSR